MSCPTCGQPYVHPPCAGCGLPFERWPEPRSLAAAYHNHACRNRSNVAAFRKRQKATA